MVVIYAAQYSPRLQYIASFIFNDLLDTPFQIITDPHVFKTTEAIKISYGQSCENDTITIPFAPNLLFEKPVTTQQINAGELDGFKTLFAVKTGSSNVFPFDIFTASFYLVSRYEEYLPNDKDEHGRYNYKESVAFRKGFLHQPLVNMWIKYFAEWLKHREPSFRYELPAFKFIPTYDVDIAYAYKGQGFLKNLYHLSKSFLTRNTAKAKRQLDVLKGKTRDPFDHFEDLARLNKTYNLPGIFFLLTNFKRSKYDRNIIISDSKTKQLFQQISASNITALHPSYQSGDDDNLLFEEKTTLDEVLQKQQTNSRYHYLRFTLPGGYRRLLNAGFTNDYSMGYGAVNGFRASIASPFFWYDLTKDIPTILKVHPFCFMDSTSIFNLKQTPSQAFTELQNLYDSCKNVGGECITIFHNHLMAYPYDNWKAAYDKFLKDNCA